MSATIHVWPKIPRSHPACSLDGRPAPAGVVYLPVVRVEPYEARERPLVAPETETAVRRSIADLVSAVTELPVVEYPCDVDGPPDAS